MPEGVRIVLRAKDAAPQPGRRRHRLQRVGEGARLRCACATRTRWASASSWSCCSPRATPRRSRGRRCAATGCSSPGWATGPPPIPSRTSRASSTRTGDELNRGKFERQGVNLALQTSLERWGLVEAGARFGRVKTVPQAGRVAGRRRATTSRFSSRAVTLDTLDDLLWPRVGGRLVAEGEWNLEGMGATYPYWRLRFEGRLGRPIGGQGGAAARRARGTFGGGAAASTTTSVWAGRRSFPGTGTRS